MTKRSDSFSPQRHATRAPVEHRVRLQFEKTKEVLEGGCHNISIGGMFVAARSPQQPGATVRFELALQDGAAIRGMAEVMWVRDSDGGPGKEPGFGLKFRFLEQRDRQLIFKLVSRHIKDRLADRHSTPISEPIVGREDWVVPPVVARQAPESAIREEPPDQGLSNQDPAQASPAEEDPAREIPLLDKADRPSTSSSSGAVDLAGSIGLEETGSGLPEDWDDDPTAFNLPAKVPIPSPETDAASAPNFEPSNVGVEVAPVVADQRPMAPGSLESEIGSLSDVFMHDDFSLDLPLDQSADGNRDLPLVTAMPADAASDPYLQHLGEDHFDHRPTPKRDLPVLPVAALVMVLAAVLAYLFSDQLFDWAQQAKGAAPEPIPTASPAKELGNVYSPPPSQGETQSEKPATERRSAAPPLPPINTEPQQQEPQPQPSAAPPPASSSPTQPPRRRAFKALGKVTWRSQGQGLVVTLTTDGQVDPKRVDQFRLEGEVPREVIRLLGMAKKTSRSTLVVGAGGVKQIRFGWHKKRSGQELHLVLDMADSQSRVRGVRTEGDRILVDVGR